MRVRVRVSSVFWTDVGWVGRYSGAIVRQTVVESNGGQQQRHRGHQGFLVWPLSRAVGGGWPGDERQWRPSISHASDVAPACVPIFDRCRLVLPGDARRSLRISQKSSSIAHLLRNSCANAQVGFAAPTPLGRPARRQGLWSSAAPTIQRIFSNPAPPRALSNHPRGDETSDFEKRG